MKKIILLGLISPLFLIANNQYMDYINVKDYQKMEESQKIIIVYENNYNYSKKTKYNKNIEYRNDNSKNQK
jgi:hypothetical protein